MNKLQLQDVEEVVELFFGDFFELQPRELVPLAWQIALVQGRKLQLWPLTARPTQLGGSSTEADVETGMTYANKAAGKEIDI